MPSNLKQITEEVIFTYSPLGKAFEKQIKATEEDQGQKQVDALKSLKSSDKRLPLTKDFKSKERLYPEIIDETERIEKEEKKLIEVRWFTKDIIKPMILENLKQFVFFVIKLEIILSLCTWQMMSKTIWQSILKSLKLKQNRKIILI